MKDATTDHELPLKQLDVKLAAQELEQRISGVDRLIVALRAAKRVDQDILDSQINI